MNNNFIKLLVCLLTFACLILDASYASAQHKTQGRDRQNVQRGAAGAGQQKPEPVSPSGKIEAIKVGLVKIATASDEFWLVKIPRSAEIHVVGAAKPDFLRSGLFVRFKVKIDKRGTALEKVAKLTIFTPTESSVLGLFPESGFSGGPDAAVEAEAETTKKKKAGGKTKKQPLQEAVYEINGQLGGVKRNGQWMLNTPHGNITFELAEEVDIAVDMADYSYAKPGDAISCRGMQVGERAATANSVEIELAEPLGGIEKKGKVSRRSKSSKSSDSKSDGDESEEDADKDGNDEEKTDAKKATAKKPVAKKVIKDDTEEYDPEQAEKLAELLEPKGKFATGESLELTVKGDTLTFGPSTQGPSLTLQKRFGKPKITYARGAVTAADGAAGSPSQWKIYIWGPVKVAIDKNGKARFYSYQPEKQ